MIPPRLHDNIQAKFANIYNWSDDPAVVQRWIHEAYLTKSRVLPYNSRELYANNRSGSAWS